MVHGDDRPTDKRYSRSARYEKLNIDGHAPQDDIEVIYLFVPLVAVA